MMYLSLYRLCSTYRREEHLLKMKNPCADCCPAPPPPIFTLSVRFRVFGVCSALCARLPCSNSFVLTTSLSPHAISFCWVVLPGRILKESSCFTKPRTSFLLSLVSHPCCSSLVRELPTGSLEFPFCASPSRCSPQVHGQHSVTTGRFLLPHL